MPLQLGDASTDRPHIVTWDPEVYEQVADARKQIKDLEAQGYVRGAYAPGEVVLQPPERNPNIGVFRVLSQNGDDRIVWDRTDPAQVREAYTKFNALIAKGYAAYATHSDGRKGHKIDLFDPGLQEIILVPGTVPG